MQVQRTEQVSATANRQDRVPEAPPRFGAEDGNQRARRRAEPGAHLLVGQQDRGGAEPRWCRVTSTVAEQLTAITGGWQVRNTLRVTR
ncbi:MAG: hypothetical protein IPL43_00085 [Micropruina sp.]|nr:hypothetical protein [Micropruina sp.]